MIIKHFDINTPDGKLPEREGWEQLPFGYYWMTKCQSGEFRAKANQEYNEIQNTGNIPGTKFQQDCLLSVLCDIKKDNVNIFELGAGWGRICLNLAGAINFGLINCEPKKYRCLAVEPDPAHYEWLTKHFAMQDISGIALFGAVSHKNGRCHFDCIPSSDSEYGQAISSFLNRRGLPIFQNFRKFLSGKTINVPMYTLDYLIDKYEFDHVDIVQMDVQGAEYNVIRGAVNSIKGGRIDYFLINVHAEKYGDMIYRSLKDKYDLVINLKGGGVGIVDGFLPIECHDGIQLYRRKALNYNSSS